MKHLCDLGYSATDIITTLFRVVRNYKMQEFLKLEFIKVVFEQESCQSERSNFEAWLHYRQHLQALLA